MRNTNILFLFIVLFLSSCCLNRDYSKSLQRYKEAKDVLLKYRKEIAKYGNNKDNILLLVDRNGFTEIVEKELNPELKKILDLWKDNLLSSKGNALIMYNDNEIIFIARNCKNREERIIFSVEGIEMFQTDETSFDILDKGWYLRIDKIRD